MNYSQEVFGKFYASSSAAHSTNFTPAAAISSMAAVMVSGAMPRQAALFKITVNLTIPEIWDMMGTSTCRCRIDGIADSMLIGAFQHEEFLGDLLMTLIDPRIRLTEKGATR